MKLPGPFLEVVAGPADADLEIERVLGIARGMAEPELANRERVSAALQLVLTPPSVSAVVQRSALEHAQPSSLQAIPPQALPPQALPPQALASAPESRALRTVLPWFVLGGTLIGMLGFWLGQSVGHVAGRREVASAAAALPVASMRTSSSSLALPERSSPGAADSETTAPRGEAPARRARAATAKRSEPHTVSSAKPALAALSFREVLEQLRRARRQLDSGQPTASLILLSELDRGAGELLREEREATRVLALCAAGQDEAARRAAALLSNESPRSIYAMRLASSCVGGADRNQ